MRLSVVLAAALVAAPVAQAGGFYEAKVLEPAASYVAKKPVKVWCSKTQAGWISYIAATAGATDGTHGSTIPGSSETHLERNLCAALTAQLGDYSVPDVTLAPTIEVLTHESIHMRGESNEGVTDCGAMHEMPGVAVRFFGVKSGKPVRALMAAAWTWHRDPRTAPVYRSVC